MKNRFILALVVVFLSLSYQVHACTVIKAVYWKHTDDKEWKLRDKAWAITIPEGVDADIWASMGHPKVEGAVYYFSKIKCGVKNASADVSLEVDKIPMDGKWDVIWKKEAMEFEYSKVYPFYYDVLDRNFMVYMEFRN